MFETEQQRYLAVTTKVLTFNILKTSFDYAWSFTNWRNNNKNWRIKQIGRSFDFT